MNVCDYFFETSGQLDKPAVVGRESTTYPELLDNVNKTARKLRKNHGETILY